MHTHPTYVKGWLSRDNFYVPDPTPTRRLRNDSAGPYPRAAAATAQPARGAEASPPDTQQRSKDNQSTVWGRDQPSKGFPHNSGCQCKYQLTCICSVPFLLPTPYSLPGSSVLPPVNSLGSTTHKKTSPPFFFPLKVIEPSSNSIFAQEDNFIPEFLFNQWPLQGHLRFKQGLSKDGKT